MTLYADLEVGTVLVSKTDDFVNVLIKREDDGDRLTWFVLTTGECGAYSGYAIHRRAVDESRLMILSPDKSER